MENGFRASLQIQRAEDREKIFRQIKQNSARVVNPTRREVVKYDGKDSAEISCDEFLEVPKTKTVSAYSYRDGNFRGTTLLDGDRPPPALTLYRWEPFFPTGRSFPFGWPLGGEI